MKGCYLVLIATTYFIKGTVFQHRSSMVRTQTASAIDFTGVLVSISLIRMAYAWGWCTPDIVDDESI